MLTGNKGEHILSQPVFVGDYSLARYLVDKGALNNANDAYRYLLLRTVVRTKRHLTSDLEYFVDSLFDSGMDINIQNKSGLTPLMICAETRGNAKLLNYLLDRGADVNHVSKYGGTALLSACFSGNPDIVKLLIDSGADVNIHAKYFKTIKNRGIVTVNLANSRDGFNMTPLMSACFSERISIIRYLLQNGAEVNAIRVVGGKTALIFAEERGVYHIVDLLRKNGALD